MSNMIEKMEDLRSARNPKARIKVLRGYFVTSNSHLNTYIDMSTVKCRHNNARETAKVLAEEYKTNTHVNTIVCLDETEVIGTFLAEQLADSSGMSLSAGNNISVLYYGGTICGVCAVFSAVSKVAGMEIKTIFTSKDVPDYRAYEPGKCPMCQNGEKIEAIVNSFGYSRLE